ncbi:MAG: hypothetical protein ACRYFX_19025 [Janthinobacterium lividum]
MKQKLTPEQAKLKQFMADNFCFYGMKEWGFWPKGTRATDFEAQAARVCQFFGYQSVYEYGRNLPEVVDVVRTNDLTGQREHSGVVAFSMPSQVNGAGELVSGGAGILHVSKTDFECPACTCKQQLRNHMARTQKCKGCKRTLGVEVDVRGGIHVWEK